MKVLIACEYSGIVRDAFIKVGHDAMSCDLLPTETPGPHYEGSVLDVINNSWDMILAFPPCTDLSYAQAGPRMRAKIAAGKPQAALEFIKVIYSAADKVCIENPVGWLNFNWKRPDMIFHPYYFGDPYYKRTCFWLKGLPPLIYGPTIQPTHKMVSSSSNWRSGKPKPIKAHTAKDKAKFHPGVAFAMAEQWGEIKRAELDNISTSGS